MNATSYCRDTVVTKVLATVYHCQHLWQAIANLWKADLAFSFCYVVGTKIVREYCAEKSCYKICNLAEERSYSNTGNFTVETHPHFK